MIHAIYIGPLQHLKGQGALIEVDLPEPSVISHANADYVPEVIERPGPVMVKAQFDNTRLTRSDIPLPAACIPELECRRRYQGLNSPIDDKSLKLIAEDALGFGWHLFPASDFKVEKG